MRLSLAANILIVSLCHTLVRADLSNDNVVYESDLDEQGPFTFQRACPDYTKYALRSHKPLSDGPLALPFQRPHTECRKFSSPDVEKVIDDLYPKFKDRDLAHIFQNAFPNTLDTTVLWHVDGVKKQPGKDKYIRPLQNSQWSGAHSFIVTGDINAEWLRDSTNQLAQYQSLTAISPSISHLIKGAIATQAEFVIEFPFCNAFQPPNPSRLPPSNNGQQDAVRPTYEPHTVFECKYELDSLAAFLSLSNQYYNSSGKTDFLNRRWYLALKRLTEVLEQESQPTFSDDQRLNGNVYTFSRITNQGTETLPLSGLGNPLANGTGLVRSAFRPSDDATIFPFLIPANAMMSVELNRTATMLNTHAATLENKSDADTLVEFAAYLTDISSAIRAGIMRHGTTTHPDHGKVFAYEVDGYGSHLLMDDANIPSLLALPLLGFITDTETETIYANTRAMVLSPANPYFISGPAFRGIGGPHIGLRNAWPMSVLVQAMTSDDDEEIIECLERVKKVSIFGLINESVDVRVGPSKGSGQGMTRPWFAWANSVFAQAILKISEERHHLLFASGKQRYVVGKGFVNKN